jgi:adenine/guanine phosphoribosyltransferase-like PRPP-binding protein
VILVDDLVTTGSTLAECARTLREAGIPVACGVAMGFALSTDDSMRVRGELYTRL